MRTLSALLLIAGLTPAAIWAQRPDKVVTGISPQSPVPVWAGCEFFQPLASPAELSSTPRDPIDFHYAEYLAVTATGRFVATESDYRRTQRDVSALPGDFRWLPPVAIDGRSLRLTLESDTFASWHEGRFTPTAFWSCAFRFYDLRSIWFSPDTHSVGLRFKGIYNTRLLASQMQGFSGVLAAYVDYVGFPSTDGPKYCLTIEADHYHYMLDDASGDCPAGCTIHDYSHYESLPDSAPALKGTWTDRNGGLPPPEFAAYMGCLVRTP